MNKNLKIKSYLERKIYYFDEEYLKVLKNILDLKYKVIEEFKNDTRTYVAKIIIDDKNYILKKIYTTKKRKKILSIFKKGEALSTLLNINEGVEKGITELAKPLGAVVERKNGIITNEILLIEYYNGKIVNEDKEYFEILKALNKIYLLKRFHGDCNPANFFYINGKIIILGTKLKKMLFGNYRQHYDILTLMKHFRNKIDYPYKKNIFYYFAAFVRKMRDKKRERNE